MVSRIRPTSKPATKKRSQRNAVLAHVGLRERYPEGTRRAPQALGVSAF